MTQPILLVEDEEHDVIFMQIALSRAEVGNRLILARDGREAIDYLMGAGKFADRQEYPLPRLALLDLRLPELSGFDVLSWIRQQPALARLPVIVLTTSCQHSDVVRAYQLGADAFVVKPSRPAELLEIVRRIKKYWLGMESPPPHCAEWLAITVPRPSQDRPFC